MKGEGERGKDKGGRGTREIFRLPPSSLPLPPSSFRLLLDAPASGAWNMAVDEALLEAAAEGQSTLRFYRWAEPTLSLGYFQTYGDRFQHEASRGCAAVRRPSGGGAILHDRELTYSLAVPERHPLAANRLRTYRAVHQALIAALGRWGIEAGMLTCATAGRGCAGSRETTLARSASEGFGAAPGSALTLALSQGERGSNAQREPFLCFQRRSPGDVLVGGVKVAGSAQRRCRGAVLQHGSLLLARSPAAPELDGLKELTGKAVDAEEFHRGLAEGAWQRAGRRVAAGGPDRGT